MWVSDGIGQSMARAHATAEDSRETWLITFLMAHYLPHRETWPPNVVKRLGMHNYTPDGLPHGAPAHGPRRAPPPARAVWGRAGHTAALLPVVLRAAQCASWLLRRARTR